ncbi:hypothetical protein D3W54_07735 [Komagataeibacter medellinensis]|uniref:Uncharacterized protein n=1 Tax=Komagataeibacter medellinensis TaxID=1177712 RepID=A0ABQ6VVA2_9PROT|nr:DUF6587 family protein [Komagataeibacter medellinensis]KAB8124110.1 hypothetical protein D3W54_07735 [Komagataeibacter medellinensis]
MHAVPWFQVVVAGTVVLACAIYWLGRLFPALGYSGWQVTGTVLRRLHAPARMVHYTTRRAEGGRRGGCGSCSGCGGRNTRPRQHD